MLIIFTLGSNVSMPKLIALPINLARSFDTGKNNKSLKLIPKRGFNGFWPGVVVIILDMLLNIAPRLSSELRSVICNVLANWLLYVLSSVKSMFASSDTENTLLALEILANAKIPEENRVLVILLLYNNYYGITPLVKTNNINKFLKLYKYEYKLGRESMSHVMGLLMDKYYSPKFESFIKSLIVDYINKHLLNGKSSKYRISAVELS